MRRLLGLVFAALAASLLLAASAGPAFASGVRCGDVVTADTTLDADLAGCTGDGLVVGAPGITIDLNGHTVSGAGTGYGISDAAGLDAVTVKNGTIQGFGTDVFARGDHQTFDHLHVGGILDACCRGATGTEPTVGTQVLDSHVFGKNHGPAWSIRLGTDSLLRDTQVNDGGVYVMGGKVAWNYIESPDQNAALLRVVGPTIVTGNWFTGVVSVTGPSVRLDHNDIAGGLLANNDGTSTAGSLTVDSNTLSGARVSGNWCSTITGNRVSDPNPSYGISARGLYITGGCASTSAPCASISRNRIENSGNAIFAVADSSGGACPGGYQIAQNSVMANHGNGVIANGDGFPIRISGNVVNRNRLDGILVDSATTSVIGNRVWMNGGLGIEAPDGTPGRNNSASRNGNPAQCVPISLCSVVPTP